MVMAKGYVALGSRYCRKTESLVGSSFMVTSGSTQATVNRVEELSTKGGKGRSETSSPMSSSGLMCDVKQASKGARPGQLGTSTDIDIPRTGYCPSGYGSKDQKPRWKEMARASGAGGLPDCLLAPSNFQENRHVWQSFRGSSTKHRRVFPWSDEDSRHRRSH